MAGKDRLRSRTTELDEALDKSLALLARGKTPEDCLDRFPERAQELRPLLEVAAQISRVPPPIPPSTDGAKGKQRMLDALVQKKAAQPGLGARLSAWIESLFVGAADQRVEAQRVLRSTAAAAAVVLLIAAGALAVRSWQQGMTVRQEAVLASRGGLVEVLPLGADAWLPVSGTMLVEAGDRIRTGAEGAAVLTFFDGSITELRPMAELSIARMTSQRAGGEKVIVLHQWLGESRYRVEPLVDETSRFSVQTASVVASVRGTVFTVTVAPDGTTHVEVEEGVVEVQTLETSVLVNGGEEFLAPSPAGSVTPITDTPAEPSGASPSPTETPTTSSAMESPEPLALTETAQTPALDATQTTEGITTPQPTSTEGEAPTATESSRPTATESSPTETEPSPTSPTETQPSPTETQPSPTETQPPPTETEPSPTETQPPPTETEPSPTETEPPPTETEPPPTEPSPTETRVKETPPGHTNTPEPPGQTKTPPGQDKKTPEPDDDSADLSSGVGPGAFEQDRRSSFLHDASFLVEQLNTGPIWLGILAFFLPLSLLLQDER